VASLCRIYPYASIIFAGYILTIHQFLYEYYGVVSALAVRPNLTLPAPSQRSDSMDRARAAERVFAALSGSSPEPLAPAHFSAVPRGFPITPKRSPSTPRAVEIRMKGTRMFKRLPILLTAAAQELRLKGD